MKFLELPKLNELNSLFYYINGELYWKKTTGKRSIKDTKAGYLMDPYLYVRINRTSYAVHRIIWKMEYGVDPIGDIDHINHTKTDNKIENLREVSRQENNMNRPLQKNNSSNEPNIRFRYNKWYVQITYKKVTYCKTFKTIEEAIQHRNEKFIEFGFHINHNK